MIYLLYDIYMIDCSIYSLPPHRRCACHSLNLVATTDVEKIKDRHFDNLLKSCVSKVSNFNFLVGGILLANCCSFFRSEVFGIIKAEVPRRQTLFVTNWADCLLFPTLQWSFSVSNECGVRNSFKTLFVGCEMSVRNGKCIFAIEK